MIPIQILKQMINHPCIYKDQHGKDLIGLVKSVGLGNLQRKSYKVEVEVFHAETEIFETYVTSSDKIRMILKHVDDLNAEQLLRLFKLYFENPTGIHDEFEGAVINTEVQKVEATGEPHQWQVTSKINITVPSDDEFKPLEEIQTDKFTIPPGSMEFLTIPAFNYLIEQGVDAYGMKQANLAVHISEVPGMVDVGGFTLPIDSIVALGFQKEDITRAYVFNRK